MRVPRPSLASSSEQSLPCYPEATWGWDGPTAAAPRRWWTALQLPLLGLGIGADGIMAALLVTSGAGHSGVIQLSSTPSGAKVLIDGKDAGARTPMSIRLKPGEHEFELLHEGFRTETLRIDMPSKGELDERIELFPLSQPGLQTLTIDIHPRPALLTVDGVQVMVRGLVRLPDIDPKVPHRITVQAGGFQTLQRTVGPGELQSRYRFILAPALGQPS